MFSAPEEDESGSGALPLQVFTAQVSFDTLLLHTCTFPRPTVVLSLEVGFSGAFRSPSGSQDMASLLSPGGAQRRPSPLPVGLHVLLGSLP